MRRLKVFLFAELVGTLLCVGIIVFGTALFMFLCEFVGFVPYSDRPGPGFYGWLPLRSLSDVGAAAWFQLGFALFAAPFFAMYAVPALTIFFALRLTTINRWFLAVPAALVFGFVAFYIMAAMGWYIAISGVAVIAAGVLGIVFGALCFLLWFPRPLGQPPKIT
jgi:hypothetical protein